MNTDLYSLNRIIYHAWNKGLVGALILISAATIYYVFSVNVFSPVFGLIAFLLTYGVLIVFMYKGAVSFRNEINIEKMDFVPTLLVLASTGFIIYILHALFNLILNTVIDPNYSIELMKQFEEAISEAKIDEEMKQNLIEKTKANLNPVKQFTSSLMVAPILSTIIGVIMVFFVRKNPNYNKEAM